MNRKIRKMHHTKTRQHKTKSSQGQHAQWYRMTWWLLPQGTSYELLSYHINLLLVYLLYIWKSMLYQHYAQKSNHTHKYKKYKYILALPGFLFCNTWAVSRMGQKQKPYTYQCILICSFSVFVSLLNIWHTGHTWKCMNVIALANKYQKWQFNRSSDGSFFCIVTYGLSKKKNVGRDEITHKKKKQDFTS